MDEKHSKKIIPMREEVVVKSSFFAPILVVILLLGMGFFAGVGAGRWSKSSERIIQNQKYFLDNDGILYRLDESETYVLKEGKLFKVTTMRDSK